MVYLSLVHFCFDEFEFVEVYVLIDLVYFHFFFFSSSRRQSRCALVTGVQTCALPICPVPVVPSRHGDVVGIAVGAAPGLGRVPERDLAAFQPAQDREDPGCTLPGGGSGAVRDPVGLHAVPAGDRLGGRRGRGRRAAGRRAGPRLRRGAPPRPGPPPPLRPERGRLPPGTASPPPP